VSLSAADRLANLPARGLGSSRLPRSRPTSKGRSVLLLGIGIPVVLLLIGGGYFALNGGRLFARAPFNGLTYTAHKERLKIAIVARGSLESAKNGDVICTVRAGQKGSTNSTVIKWLVDAGSEVQKGDKIMELDSSGFIENLKDQNIKVDGAKAEMIKSEEDYRIQEIENENDILKNENILKLAEIDLEKYIKGDYVQALKDVEGRMTTATSDLEDWKDRAAWSQRMWKKGLMSKVQADADASRTQGAAIAVQKLEEEKRVLTDYTKNRTIQDLTSKLKEAKLGMEKAKGKARATLAQADALRLAKKSVYEQELSRKREIEAEIAKCQVFAPQDGLVVYYIPEQAQRGGGAQQSVVAQGEPVREGQKMIQIPDLSLMMVNVRVPEAFVSHLHSEDPEDKSTWQHAQIRVDAFPNRILKGHVKTVDLIASQTDWFNSDVKVYKTMVSIAPGQIDNLKPGMSAEVTINAEESSDPVLVLPIQAVIGTISMGEKRKCFVIGADGQTEMRDIVVGMSNERLVEVRSGVQEGEKVVENPKPLISEESDLKPGKVRAKQDDAEHSPGDSTGGGKKAKGKKKADGVPGGPGGPGGPSPGAGGAKGFSGGPPSAEQLQQMRQNLLEKARAMTPAERRDMINATPDTYRPQVRQLLQENKLEIAN
jgi:multidrug efflux pump subunit AcrA (membrane-fusion protein)